MTSQEFIEEVLASNICPQNFLEEYKDFQHYQKLATDTLREVHRIFDKNGIEYVLGFGSLLGAIRDNGQIPWDYDIDIFVPHVQNKKMIEVLKNELDEKYYFYGPSVDKKCPHGITKVTPKGYRSRELHVDIFYYTGTPEDENGRKEFQRRLTWIEEKRYAKYINPFTACRKDIKLFIALVLRKLGTIGISGKKLRAEYEELCSKYPPKESTLLCGTTLGAKNRTYKQAEMCERILYKTSEGEFYITKHYEDVLKLLFGGSDAMLPLEDRLREFTNSYNRLKKYAKI